MKSIRFVGAVIGIAFAVAILGVWYGAQAANERDADNAVSACQRGNIVRAYLAFDNDGRLLRITTGLDDPETPDKSELHREQVKRLAFRESLQPFDCESLR